MPATDNPSQSNPATPGLSWVHDATDALLWVRLLRVPAIAARPQRVLLSLFLVVLVGFFGRLRFPWQDPDTPPVLEALFEAKLAALAQIWQGTLALDTAAATAGFTGLIADVPELMVARYPVETIFLIAPILFVFAVLGGAVSRSVACEFSQELTLPWTRQLGFALERWRSFVGVLAIPAALIGIIALALATAGFLLFNVVPGLEVIGAILFGIALFLGLTAVVLLVLTTLAWPMLLPAAACEGTDAIDAVGRALAYTIARPVRLIIYLLVAGLVCALASVVALAIANGTVAFTEATATAWVSAQGQTEVTGTLPPAPTDAEGTPAEIGALAATSSWIIAFWASCLHIIVAAYAVSMALSAGTLVYLFMRQICDGQHHAELWTPGQIEQAFQAAMRTDDNATAQSNNNG